MEARSLFCPAHFKLILHSIRNLCKFAEPFAIQYAAIITDGYSSDCFQLIFFHPTWKSGRTNKGRSEYAILDSFCIIYVAVERRCECESSDSLVEQWSFEFDFYSLNEYPSKINKTILLIPIKSIFSSPIFASESVAGDVCHLNGIGYIEIESKHKQWITFRREEKCEIKRSQVCRAKKVERKCEEPFEGAMLQKSRHVTAENWRKLLEIAYNSIAIVNYM